MEFKHECQLGDDKIRERFSENIREGRNFTFTCYENNHFVQESVINPDIYLGVESVSCQTVPKEAHLTGIDLLHFHPNQQKNEIAETTVDFYHVLRNSSRHKIYVSNQADIPVVEFIRAEHYIITNKRVDIVTDLKNLITEGSIVIISAGLLTNFLLRELYLYNPHVTYIDIGSSLDYLSLQSGDNGNHPDNGNHHGKEIKRRITEIKGNLFLITSVIIPSETPLSYVSTRSLYSVQQRVEQTLKTIQSIRNRARRSQICLVEGSTLPESIEIQLKNEVDYYFNLSQNVEIKINIDSPYKCLGEKTIILEGLKCLEKYLQENENIFKISGRYYLNSEFDLSNYYEPYNYFQLCGDRYATTLYKIHKNNLSNYTDALKNMTSYDLLIGMEMAIYRHYLPDHPDNRFLNQVGVTGLISVFKDTLISN